MRHSLLSRGTKYLTALILALGAVMLYLLSSASANTPSSRATCAGCCCSAWAWCWFWSCWWATSCWRCAGDCKAGLFGSKLTLRLVLLFSLVAVLPGALVYAVSVQFLNKSIESWFDVRVDKALEGGLSLGRTTLDNMLRDLNAKAESMALSARRRAARAPGARA